MFRPLRTVALWGALLLPVVPNHAAQSSGAPAQNPGVVVLEESDFERVPDSAPVGKLRSTRPAASNLPSGNGEVHHFDPGRDARADVRHALQVAAREGKHVLLDVGGNWCSFCKVLDDFFVANPEVAALRSRNFVYVKVNFSQENQNQDLLDAYPLIRGFPHFFVLDGNGKLVSSQRVALLGTRTGYSASRFKAFLQSAAPKPK